MRPSAIQPVRCENRVVAKDDANRTSRERDGELFDLVVSYARQETIEPLRGVGRWVAFGLISMGLISVGMVLVSLGLLRAVQDIGGTTFDGAWSFVPYIFGVVFASVIVAIAISQIKRPRL